MFWDNFIKLCADNQTTPTEVVTKLNISRGSVTHWKRGKIPHPTKQQKIADYFNVPVDYLVNSTSKPHETFISYQSIKDKVLIDSMSETLKAITAEQVASTPMEQTLLDAFRASTDAGRMQILEAALKAKMANEGSDVAQKKES